MGQTNEAKNVNIDVRGTLGLADAKTINIFERRRITLAIRQRPDVQWTLTGDIHIYASIVDEIDWYVLLGTVNINTAADQVEFYNIINSITNGAAMRMLRVTYTDIANGSIDMKVFKMES